MKQRLMIILIGIPFIVATFFTGSKAQDKQAETASIEGSYILVKRELPDGKTQGPPDIMGMMTFTKKYRNFNIIIKNKEGKYFSNSMVIEYTLSSGEYTEKVLFSITNDEMTDEAINHVVSGKLNSSPVTSEGKSIKYKQPPDGPNLTFKENKVIAEGDNFVDFWEKVD